VPGEVLVVFHAGVTPQRIAAILSTLRLRVKVALSRPGAYVLLLEEGVALPEVLAQLRALPEVAQAEPNRRTFLRPPGPRPGPIAPETPAPGP
jgi:hypothetical protein